MQYYKIIILACIVSYPSLQGASTCCTRANMRLRSFAERVAEFCYSGQWIMSSEEIDGSSATHHLKSTQRTYAQARDIVLKMRDSFHEQCGDEYVITDYDPENLSHKNTGLSSLLFSCQATIKMIRRKPCNV